MTWIRTRHFGGWVWRTWRIRGPIQGRPEYWLYRAGQRYPPTGDPLVFLSLKAAQAHVAQAEASTPPSSPA